MAMSSYSSLLILNILRFDTSRSPLWLRAGIVVASGIMFFFRSSVHPILVKVISQECIEGISLKIAQTSTCTQG